MSGAEGNHAPVFRELGEEAVENDAKTA